MKFDIPIPCFFGNDNFCESIKKIKKLGFDAVETYDWKCLDFSEVKETCEETNVKLISICTSDFRMTDEKYKSDWLKGLEESIEAAKKLGVTKMITQVGNDTGESRKKQHSNIVSALNDAKNMLEENGITLMLEPLNVLYNHKGYYLYSSIEGFEIIKEVNSQNIKIIFDIYHQQVTEGNIINNIKENLDCIAHLHCAGHPGRNELQYGENDYNVIFNSIDQMGYDGYCGLEYTPLLEAIESLNEFKRIYLK